MFRCHPTLIIALLLVSCDKRQEVDGAHAAEKQPPASTRAERPPRVEAQRPEEELRESLKAAVELETPAERDKAVAQVAWDALELDPELAREAFDKLSPGSPERIRLIQHFAMQLAERSPDEALEWAAALGNELETSAACGRIALVISATDPERAGHLLSESGLEGREFDVAVVQVLQRWAAKSPPDAAAWVVLFPPGKAREAGLKTTVSQWARNDAAAAFSWMTGLTDQAVRKESAQAMAEALLEQPENVRKQWLGHAGPEIRKELEARWQNANQETGNAAPFPVD